MLIFLIALCEDSFADRGIKIKLRASEKNNAPVVEEVDLYSSSYALV